MTTKLSNFDLNETMTTINTHLAHKHGTIQYDHVLSETQFNEIKSAFPTLVFWFNHGTSEFTWFDCWK